MASLKDRAKKSRILFTLDTPSQNYLTPDWPQISPEASIAVLAKLTELISHVQSLRSSSTSSTENDDQLARYFIIGANPTTAYLESLAPKPSPNNPTSSSNHASKLKSKRRLMALFVTRADQPSQLHSHIPLLCALSSTPLIPLAKNAEPKLARLIGPSNGRVYMLGVYEDAPGSNDLRELLETLSAGGAGQVALPDAFQSLGWLETRVAPVQVTIGERRKRKGGSNAADKMPSKTNVVASDATGPAGKKAKKTR